MGRIIRGLIWLVVFGMIGLVAFAYLGDLSPAQVQVSTQVVLSAD